MVHIGQDTIVEELTAMDNVEHTMYVSFLVTSSSQASWHLPLAHPQPMLCMEPSQDEGVPALNTRTRTRTRTRTHTHAWGCRCGHARCRGPHLQRCRGGGSCLELYCSPCWPPNRSACLLPLTSSQLPHLRKVIACSSSDPRSVVHHLALKQITWSSVTALSLSGSLSSLLVAGRTSRLRA